jgi:carbon monoxide dehydrogenase subunit G
MTTAQVEISSLIAVPAAPDEVWRAVIDWAGQHRWMVGTRVHGGHGLGAKVVARTGIGPLRFTDTMVISEWDPPRRCVVRHTGRVVRGSGIFEVTPSGAGAEFRWTEHLDLPLTGTIQRLGWPLVRPLAQRGMDYSLRRFARLVQPTR